MKRLVESLCAWMASLKKWQRFAVGAVITGAGWFVLKISAEWLDTGGLVCCARNVRIVRGFVQPLAAAVATLGVFALMFAIVHRDDDGDDGPRLG